MCKLDQCKSIKGPKKGKCFEDFVAELLESILGLHIVKRNVRSVGEIDILAKVNEQCPLRILIGGASPYVVVECKLRKKRVKDCEVLRFTSDVAFMTNLVGLQLIVAVPGLEPKAWRKVCEEMKERNLRILVLEEEDLLEILRNKNLDIEKFVDRLVEKLLEKCKP